MHFRTMVKRAIHTLTLFLVLINVAGCTTNPYTNRSQFLLIPESQEVHMGNRPTPKLSMIQKSSSPRTRPKWNP